MDIAELIEKIRAPEARGLVAEFAFIFALLPLVAFSHRALAPILCPGKFRWHVTLGDGICLGVMVLPLALLHLLTGADWQNTLPLDLCFMTFTGALWGLGVGSASAAGIRDPWLRAAAIMVIYPLNTLGTLVVAGLWAASIADQVSAMHNMSPTVHTAFAIVMALILGAILISARLVRRIAAALEPETADSQSVLQSEPNGTVDPDQENAPRDPWRDGTD